MVSLLFGVVQLDAMTFAGLADILALVSLLAGYIPARPTRPRARPAIALRVE